MDSDSEHAANVGLSVSMTSEFLIGVVAALFVVFAFLFFVYLYAKRYTGGSISILSARFMLPNDHAIVWRDGLDPEAIQALPITLFRTENLQGRARVLCLPHGALGWGGGWGSPQVWSWVPSRMHRHMAPLPQHMPLCRSVVVSDPSASLPPQDAILVDIPVVVESGFAADRMGAMGESSRGSCSRARREGMLVIEIPMRGGGVGQSSLESSLPTSRMQDGGEMKTPASGRMRSMRRMMSRGSRGGGGGGGGGGDVERGVGEGSQREVDLNL